MERGVRFHFLPSEDGTILAVGVGTTAVGTIGVRREERGVRRGE